MGKAQPFLSGATLATKLPLISVILYLLLSTLVFFAGDTKAQDSSEPVLSKPLMSDKVLSDQDKEDLIYLLTQDCGSCHGLTLQGGLGPALLKKNLQGKPAEYLSAVIKYGRPGTPMPPWQNILSDKEINFLAEYLVSDINKLATYQKFISQPVAEKAKLNNSEKKTDKKISDSNHIQSTTNTL